MNTVHYINSNVLGIEDIDHIISNHMSLALSEEAKLNIEKCRTYLDTRMKEDDRPIYGINTGWGSFVMLRSPEIT